MHRTLSAKALLLSLALAIICLCTPAAGASVDEREALSGEDVTIIAGEDRTVYEYRQNGHLRMVRVVPRFGRPYYLVPADPTRGFGELDDGQTLVPSWRVVEF